MIPIWLLAYCGALGFGAGAGCCGFGAGACGFGAEAGCCAGAACCVLAGFASVFAAGCDELCDDLTSCWLFDAGFA